jgi:hypothetical protein
VTKRKEVKKTTVKEILLGQDGEEVEKTMTRNSFHPGECCRWKI